MFQLQILHIVCFYLALLGFVSSNAAASLKYQQAVCVVAGGKSVSLIMYTLILYIHWCTSDYFRGSPFITLDVDFVRVDSLCILSNGICNTLLTFDKRKFITWSACGFSLLGPAVHRFIDPLTKGTL